MSTPKFKLQYLLHSLNWQRFSCKTFFRARDKEDVVISGEGKRQFLLDKFTKEIMDEFKTGTVKSSMAGDILEQLSLEYGKSLKIFSWGQGGIEFEVVDQDHPKILSGGENKELEMKLFNLTRLTVSRAIWGRPEACLK